MAEKRISPIFRFLKGLLKLAYPRIEIVGAENLPDKPALVVGNHAQMDGPIACELYFPGKRYTWCAGQMMQLKEVPAYAFEDFWSLKPKATHWFYRILSYLIAPLSVFVFSNAYTIGVYRDTRIIKTFRETVARLGEGAHVVIFPEYNRKYNNIIYDFQEGFVDIARMYHKKTGVELQFVPMYVAPRLKKLYLGKPVQFCASNPLETERKRIREYLMREITDMACALPRHTVVPYRNIAKKDYPLNIPCEVSKNEETRC